MNRFKGNLDILWNGITPSRQKLGLFVLNKLFHNWFIWKIILTRDVSLIINWTGFCFKMILWLKKHKDLLLKVQISCFSSLTYIAFLLHWNCMLMNENFHLDQRILRAIQHFIRIIWLKLFSNFWTVSVFAYYEHDSTKFLDPAVIKTPRFSNVFSVKKTEFHA